MANKNRNLILAYFDTVEAAETATDAVMEWDKRDDRYMLGGMGVITMDESGKLHVHRVGRRAAGTGAKWGLILGAAAGVLSGGLTIVGGALAGLATGIAGGALFHKKLGMTDDDKLRLEMHLKNGGAAVGVMVDDDELAPTRAELYNVGGDVEHYIVPDETLNELHKSVAEAQSKNVGEPEDG